MCKKFAKNFYLKVINNKNFLRYQLNFKRKFCKKKNNRRPAHNNQEKASEFLSVDRFGSFLFKRFTNDLITFLRSYLTSRYIFLYCNTFKIFVVSSTF